MHINLHLHYTLFYHAASPKLSHVFSQYLVPLTGWYIRRRVLELHFYRVGQKQGHSEFSRISIENCQRYVHLHTSRPVNIHARFIGIVVILLHTLVPSGKSSPKSELLHLLFAEVYKINNIQWISKSLLLFKVTAHVWCRKYRQKMTDVDS